MLEAILVVIGATGGFLLSLGWYKRGFCDMEKELNSIKERVDIMEKEGHSTKTDIAVLVQRMGYMEEKINDIHTAIMKPIKLGLSH